MTPLWECVNGQQATTSRNEFPPRVPTIPTHERIRDWLLGSVQIQNNQRTSPDFERQRGQSTSGQRRQTLSNLYEIVEKLLEQKVVRSETVDYVVEKLRELFEDSQKNRYRHRTFSGGMEAYAQNGPIPGPGQLGMVADASQTPVVGKGREEIEVITIDDDKEENVSSSPQPSTSHLPSATLAENAATATSIQENDNDELARRDQTEDGGEEIDDGAAPATVLHNGANETRQVDPNVARKVYLKRLRPRIQLRTLEHRRARCVACKKKR